jgi:hypothetical protein
MEVASKNRSTRVVGGGKMDRTAVGAPLACVHWSNLIGRSIMEATSIFLCLMMDEFSTLFTADHEQRAS